MGMFFDNIERVSCDSRMRYFIFNTSSKGKRSSKGSNFYGYYSKLGNNRVGKYSKDRHNITTLYISICLYILIIEDYIRHNGWLVSLLDEMPELSRSVLEVLRQPLEDRKITISRAKYNVEYPCSFMFVASMNPCPCGYYGDPTHHCVCTPGQIQRYMNKISGPLLDRIDIHCEIQAVPFAQLSQMKPGEPSAVIRERVIAARKIQEERFKPFKGIHSNAMMSERMLHEFAEPDTASLDMLRMAMERLKLSARAYSRILKVARTIADLAGSEKVESMHIAEAIGYRNLDRGDWAERGI